MDSPRILAVDPGMTSGYAYGVGGKLEASGIVQGPELYRIDEIIDDSNAQIMVVEDQYAKSFKGKINFGSIKRLLYCRHAWEILAQLNQVKVTHCYPSSWQSYYKLHKSRFESHQDYKVRIVDFAECITDRKVQRDESDAILLFFYYEIYRTVLKK